jgi:hypothetical protein
MKTKLILSFLAGAAVGGIWMMACISHLPKIITIRSTNQEDTGYYGTIQKSWQQQEMDKWVEMQKFYQTPTK